MGIKHYFISLFFPDSQLFTKTLNQSSSLKTYHRSSNISYITQLSSISSIHLLLPPSRRRGYHHRCPQPPMSSCFYLMLRRETLPLYCCHRQTPSPPYITHRKPEKPPSRINSHSPFVSYHYHTSNAPPPIFHHCTTNSHLSTSLCNICRYITYPSTNDHTDGPFFYSKS